MSKLILSVDDGCSSDMRVAGLAIKYGIETIFYIPVEWHSLAYDKGYEPLSYTQALWIAEEFEIGCHTFTHRHLTTLNEGDLFDEVVGSKIALEGMFGIEVTKFCPPRGYVNPGIKKFIDQNFAECRLTKGPGLVHIHPNSGANDNRPWRECIDENTTEIWGHSWEFNKFDLWDELEDCLANLPS